MLTSILPASPLYINADIPEHIVLCKPRSTRQWFTHELTCGEFATGPYDQWLPLSRAMV
ncbi:hypothetical protein BDV38DRAFT_259940 [Aspergillus pseudotamarii]|uniref:Uncharacterized protein n=1 Tax=Aspergillus pseudotamarii TaxID=132259 RepID=A0A5N6SE44_ASPPS|nr:uncharacterized protein BDV38DRAFT_259940 [Aspergillus pseudotamarii]KAE8132932.1 hypothetical protein BDV38DRAFT_259940 [Aspergillus pseudotamarii]